MYATSCKRGIIHRWMRSIYGRVAERGGIVEAWPAAHTVVVVCSRCDKYCLSSDRRHRIPLKLTASHLTYAKGQNTVVPCVVSRAGTYCIRAPCYHITWSTASPAFCGYSAQSHF